MAVLLGYVGVLIASIFFGSNYLPVKQFDAGDGFYFQFFQAVGIWIIGLIVNLFRSQPQFQPIAMLGGFLWCTGNTMTVKIISILGLGQGQIVWGSVNLLAGWLNGFVGIITKSERDQIDTVWLNLLGVFICLASLVVSTQIKPTMKEKDNQESLTSYQPLEAEDQSKNKSMGFLMSAFAGICYGFNFAPPIWVKENRQAEGASQELLDYVFSHFCGILIASIFYFVGYCSYKKNIPVVNPSISLPAIISGVLWAIAQTSWFVSNQELGQAVSYPLISLGPGMVSCLWGVLYFKEIEGKRNFHLLGGFFALACSGCICIALSKP